jgi:hypothetical protein
VKLKFSKYPYFFPYPMRLPVKAFAAKQGRIGNEKSTTPNTDASRRFPHTTTQRTYIGKKRCNLF